MNATIEYLEKMIEEMQRCANDYPNEDYYKGALKSYEHTLEVVKNFQRLELD